MGPPAPEGCVGQGCEGTSPEVGWCASHKGPKAQGRGKGETLGSDGPKAHLVVRPPLPPLGRPSKSHLGLAAPLGGEP